MDLIEATRDRVDRSVNGVACTFKFLTAYDRAELLRQDLVRRQKEWTARRDRLIENLKLSGVTGEQMFTELERFEDQTPQTATIHDWIEFVNDPMNEPTIFESSLRHKHGEDAKQLAKDAVIPLDLKAEICGLQLRGDEPKEKETPDPNQVPAAYSTTPETK
jgi:hypothetical protein